MLVHTWVEGALNFLTPGPGLFPRIQVLFSKAFGKVEGGVEVKLGKDFISINVMLEIVEIIVVFCQAKADNVIDVLARALHMNNIAKEHVVRALENVLEHIIDTLIRVRAQLKVIQIATLIERVIRPDCLINPWNMRSREDYCVEMNHLKELLWYHLGSRPSRWQMFLPPLP
jgi:hypothetical protein